MVAAILFATTITYAAGKKTRIYMYGFAASFNDSTVYFTDIQALDSATVEAKTHFLYARDNYSYQLRDYLRTKGMASPTCVTSFATKRKNVEKKYLAMKKKYANGKYIVKHVTPDEFKYQVIMPDETTDVDMLTKAERKALKKKEQMEEKKRKEKARADRRGAHPKGAPAGGRPNGPAPMPH